MKILILGGTYFLGKAFLETCDGNGDEITVLNRGSRPVPGNEDRHVHEILADRRDAEALERAAAQFDPEGYDCIVDFCGYEAGDVRRVLEAITASRKKAGKQGAGVRQYVFISTCDVYRRGTGKTLDENAPLEERDFGGAEGAYICGKVALEKELRQCAEETINQVGGRMHYTSVRPAFIYGPGNYAPREGIFFRWVSKAGQILFPEDADGSFQMVYVKDLARCIYACLGNENFYDCAVNVCGENIDYQRFADALEEAVEQRIEKVMLPVADVLSRGIPLPFPLTKTESETYADEKMKMLGVEMTALVQGMRETYAWFNKQETE
ncbi:MAG: NAD-dependent epimerase/dehydratase family protein [Acetatifactor sp.]|nr:NAD-dependent epimerase/dehydratase family protein [Acetatifactor sp.]